MQSENRQENFNENFSFAQKYESQFIEIIASLKLGEIARIERATPDEDKKHATDFVFHVQFGGRIGARVRVRKWWDNLRTRDFTIRRSVPSGNPTELDKWKAGDYPDLYIYAWVFRGEVVSYIIVSVNCLIKSRAIEKGQVRYNSDGSTFLAIPVDVLAKASCIVRRGGLAEAIKE